MMQDKLDKINEKLSLLETKKSGLSRRVLDNQREINEYQKLVDRRDSLTNRLDDLKSKDIDDNKEIIDKLKLDYKKLKTNIDSYKKEFEDSKDELDDLSYVKELFSSSGIRSSIIKRIVDLFNKTLGIYLKQLEAPCHVSFDENFDPVVTSLGGIEISFDNLSSGEKHRVNTALSFTFKDILRIQNQLSFNYSVIDEVFDSSIDKKALDIYGSILKDRYESLGESSCIISHRENFEIEGSKEILVEKVDGVSYIV